VQNNLLKLMEETEVPARAPNDIAGQIQAMMELTQGGGKKGASVINTKHILFIVSGAFEGLEAIVRRRMREATIGFAARASSVPTDAEMLDQVQTRDFIEFGFEPEFIGRLPVRVVCHPLTANDLFTILRQSEGSIIRQYEESFAAYGIEALFKDDGLRQIAERAFEEKTGARGLMTVCERVFRSYKFDLPSTPVKRFVVDRQAVEHPETVLARLIAAHQLEEMHVARQLVRDFTDRFHQAHGLRLQFTEAAVDRLVALAQAADEPIRDYCAARFKDYQFGLKLIAQNTGQTEFIFGVEAVEAPDQALSDRVVASYRSSPAAPSGVPQPDSGTPG